MKRGFGLVSRWPIQNKNDLGQKTAQNEKGSDVGQIGDFKGLGEVSKGFKARNMKSWHCLGAEKSAGRRR